MTTTRPDADHCDESGSSPPHMSMNTPPSAALRARDAAAYLGISRSKLYELSDADNPEVGSFKIGAARLWARKDLDAYLDRVRMRQIPPHLRAA